MSDLTIATRWQLLKWAMFAPSVTPKSIQFWSLLFEGKEVEFTADIEKEGEHSHSYICRLKTPPTPSEDEA